MLETLGLGHLALFVGMAVDRQVLEALGQPGLKVSHGYIVQRLLEGPKSMTSLAADLGVTQQAVSKTVAEMRALELVKDLETEDARQRVVALSSKGLAGVEAARVARRAIELRMSRALGPKRMAAATEVLRDALEHLGGAEAVRQRRVKPSSAFAAHVTKRR